MISIRSLLKAGFVALALLPAMVSAQQVATRFLVTEATGILPLGTTPLTSGVPTSIRVTALDEDGATVTGYARNVRVTLPDPFVPDALQVFVDIPAASFVAGVADNIAITPLHAGTANRRIVVSDGNISTYNANNNLPFSISPASFFAAQSGTYRNLSSSIVVDGPVEVRIVALNDDFSLAQSYTGLVTISSPDLFSDVDALITFGGIADNVFLFFTSDGAGQSIDISDGLVTTSGASAAGGGDTLTVRPSDNTPGIAAAANVSTAGSILRPGGRLNVSFELKSSDTTPVTSTDPLGTLSEVTLFNNSASVTYFANSNAITPGSDATNGTRGSVSFTIPDYFAPGQYTLRVNTGISGPRADTSIEIGGTPDLAIQRFDYAPGTYQAGDALRFDMVWTNLRTTTAAAGLNARVDFDQRYRVELHLSSDETFGNNDDILVWAYITLGNNQPLPDNLLPGQSTLVSGEFTLPENLPGTYYLLAKVNSEGGRGATEDVSFSTGFTEVVGPKPPTILSDGNNIILPKETQKLTILPRTSTETTRVSVTSAGAFTVGISDQPVIATDGAFIAFQSLAPLAGVTSANGFTQIFRKNPSTGTVELVSVGTDGAAANGPSSRPAISANGRYIVFESTATNLQPGDTNGFSDIYLRDMQLGITRRLSIQGSTQANSGSFKPSISANGRFITFTSTARNLAAGTTAGLSQVYLFNRDVSNSGLYDTSGNTSLTLVSSVGGVAGTAASSNARISADGNFVAFSTRAGNLLGGTTAPFSQIIRWDRLANSFVVVSANSGVRADGTADFPAINADGSKIAFVSRALNLTADVYASGVPHVFRSTIASGIVTAVVRVNGAGNVEPNNPLVGAISSPDLGSFEPSISANGDLIVFASESNNLLPAIPVNHLDRTTYASSTVFNYADQNGVADVYLADLTDPLLPVVQRASVSSFGYEATIQTVGTTLTLRVPSSRTPVISSDGRYVVFSSDAEGHNGLAFGATNFDYLDNNGGRDIYLYDRKTDIGAPTNLPLVTLQLAPALSVTSGSPVSLVADATTDTSSIAQVEFYANNIVIGTVTAPLATNTSRFVFTWTTPPSGSGNTTDRLFEVTAVAVDANGARSLVSNPSTVTVKAIVGTAPSITVNPPGVAFTTASVFSFRASASDSEGAISSVTYYLDGQNVGAGVYSSSAGLWVSPLINFSLRGAGDYNLYAVAEDSDGNQTSSAVITFSVTASAVDSVFGATLNEVFFAALGRNATDEEQLIYIGQLGASATDYEIASALMQSAAFDSTGASVINAYRAVFGEYPTFTVYQNGLIASSAGIIPYIDSLYASGEYLAKFGSLPSFSVARNVEAFASTVHTNLTGSVPSAKIKGTALSASALSLTAQQLADARKEGTSEKSLVTAAFAGLTTQTPGSVVASYILSLSGTTQIPKPLLSRARVAGVILALTEPATPFSFRETEALRSVALLDVAELYGTGTTDAAIKPIFRTLPASTAVAVGSELKFTAVVISPAAIASDISWKWTFNRRTTLTTGTAIASLSPVHELTYTVPVAVAANAGSYALSVSNRFGTTTSSTATARITPPVPAPLPGTVSLQVGVFYSVDLGPSISGMSYVVRNLPRGLSLNAATGVISGTPTRAGSFSITYGTQLGKLTSLTQRSNFIVAP